MPQYVEKNQKCLLNTIMPPPPQENKITIIFVIAVFIASYKGGRNVGPIESMQGPGYFRDPLK